MKKLLLSSGLLLTGFLLQAQNEKIKVESRKHAVSADLLLPLGNFFETHFAGFGLQYSWYKQERKLKQVKIQTVRFTANGGVSMYLGKNEKVGSGSYKYPAFTLIHTYAGAAWLPSRLFHFILSAGPGLGLYHGHSSLNLGAKLEGQVNFSNLSVGPSIRLMKEKGSDPLWAGSLGVFYFF